LLSLLIQMHCNVTLVQNCNFISPYRSRLARNRSI